MDFIRKIWNNFTTRPDVWFFYGFLATFTLSIRKVLFFYPIDSQFNEYTGIYLYLSDLFLILTLTSWIISILCNKQPVLSILKTSVVPRRTMLLPLTLVLWSFVTFFWSTNSNIALFKSIKLFEYFILFLYLMIQIVPRGTILRNTFKIIISISLIQGIIGIWQFILQHSIGLFWLKESLISPEIAGVAKIIIEQEKVVRAYGLFPHPNILGGFLLFSIIITLAYRKMFHVEQLTATTNIKCSTWNNSDCETYKPVKNVPRGTFINIISKTISDHAYFIILTIQVIATILTFSKSAILGLIIAISYTYWANIRTYAVKLFHVEQFRQKSTEPELSTKYSTWNNSHCETYKPVKNVPRGTFSGAGVEHIGRKIIIILGIIIALLAIIKPDINSLLFKSLDERMLYLNVSRGTISQNTLFGIGSGQLVLDMGNQTNQAFSDWQFQPVHNVFLLVWSELGLIGLILFIWILWKMFHVEQFQKNRVVPELNIKCSTPACPVGRWNNSRCETYEPIKNVPRGTFSDTENLHLLAKGLLLGLILIMLFDHYLWDIQQGQAMLWMVLAFLISI